MTLKDETQEEILNTEVEISVNGGKPVKTTLAKMKNVSTYFKPKSKY